MMQDKRDENIIRVLVLGTRPGLLENFFGVIANTARLGIELADLRGQCWRIFRGSGGHRLDGFALAREDIVELRLQRSELRTVAALNRALIRRLIEKHRRLFELIEEKNHRTEQQDEKLHGHFHDRVEKQTDPARAQRTAGEITLHLRLIGAKIRERKKETAEDARPECVAPGRIDRKIDGLKFSHFTSDREGVGERQVRRQSMNRDAKG